ncbi:MAG: SH3 domain-containing protein [Kiritimatiellae bacterium]|nr:SH3 domain-containing protein [Kiritimatiellia bacterium]
MTVNRTVCLLAALMPAFLQAAPERLRVTGDRVSLRARASDTVEVVGQVMNGEELIAPDGIGTGEWVRVTPPDAVNLWIYGELVRDGRVAVNKAQVRGGPGLQYKRVGEIESGAAVAVRGQLGEWLKIAPTPESSLYISRRYVQAVVPVEAPAAPVAEAPSPDLASASAVAAPAETPPAASAPPAAPAVAVPVPRRASRWPSALAGYKPDPLRPQGAPSRFEGRLVRVSRQAAGVPGSVQLVALRGRQRPVALCRLTGLEGQWNELVGATLDVRGQIWHLDGQELPVLAAERLVVIAHAP